MTGMPRVISFTVQVSKATFESVGRGIFDFVIITC